MKGLEFRELALIYHNCPTMKEDGVCEHGVGTIKTGHSCFKTMTLADKILREFKE